MRCGQHQLHQCAERSFPERLARLALLHSFECESCHHRFLALAWKKRLVQWDGQILIMPDRDSTPYIDWTGARPFYTLAVLVLLGCLVIAWVLATAGCATDQATEQDVQLQFETMMNRAVGKKTYEEFLTTWGPPMNRRETAAAISGIWEEPSMQGKRVEMVFDRKSQLLKSWSYQTR